MLAATADPDSRGYRKDKWTPLIVACRSGYLNIVKQLVAAGATTTFDNFASEFEWDNIDRGQRRAVATPPSSNSCALTSGADLRHRYRWR